MRYLGYEKDSGGALPADCVARTAAIWRPRKSHPLSLNRGYPRRKRFRLGEDITRVLCSGDITEWLRLEDDVNELLDVEMIYSIRCAGAEIGPHEDLPHLESGRLEFH